MRERVFNRMWLAEFLRDDSGADVFEYALIASLLALGSATCIKQVAPAVSGALTTVANDITNAL
jgi:Flp pilus assembly pilin Flp